MFNQVLKVALQLITDSLYYRKFFEMEKEKTEENQNKSDLYVRTSKLKKYKNEFHVHEDKYKKFVKP